jgi:hypothetical protein
VNLHLFQERKERATRASTTSPPDSKSNSPALPPATSAAVPPAISTSGSATRPSLTGAAAAQAELDHDWEGDSPRRRWAEWSDCDSELGQDDRLESPSAASAAASAAGGARSAAAGSGSQQLTVEKPAGMSERLFAMFSSAATSGRSRLQQHRHSL